MSVLVWWAIPVAVALLTGGLMSLLRGRRPPARRSFEEIERFQRFRSALERPPHGTARRQPRSTA